MIRALLIILICAAALPGQAKLTGGNGKIYIGGWGRKMLIWDEATEKVTGEIKMRTGSPRGMVLSKDKKRMYCVNEMMEGIEVADLTSGQVVDSFQLSEGNKKIRFRGITPDPLDRFLITVARSYTKHPDRWEIGPNEILQLDLKTHKVARKIPWPDNEEREGAGFRFSPDGKFLYIFGNDIVVLDTTDNFKEVDKWELSKPYEDGFGRINFGFMDDSYEEPGFFTGIFTVQDAVQNRRIMGIARVNLQQKNVDFYALGPATGVSFSMTPDRQWAYGVHEEIGKHEFWTFDLKNKRVHSKTEFAGRPRMSLKTSSNGKLLYIYQAGRTIDIYEAATYKYLRTAELDTDMTGFVLIAPQ